MEYSWEYLTYSTSHLFILIYIDLPKLKRSYIICKYIEGYPKAERHERTSISGLELHPIRVNYKDFRTTPKTIVSTVCVST